MDDINIRRRANHNSSMIAASKVLADLQRGIAAHKSGQFQQAEIFYRAALAGDRRQFDALYLLGLVQAHRGFLEEAEQLLRRAIKVNGTRADVFTHHACTLNDLSRHQEALAATERAIRIDDRSPDAWLQRARAMRGAGLFDDALSALDRVATLAPSPDVQLARGNILSDIKRFDAALACFDQAITARPDFAEAHFNKGNVLFELHRTEEAFDSYQRALHCRPGYGEAANGCGRCLLELGRPEDALAHFDIAIAQRPGFPEATMNKGLALLSLGHLPEGLALYEARLKKSEPTVFRNYTEPMWRGEDLAGKSLFVYWEQGLGDTIQFARYLPLAIEAGATVCFSGQDRLHWLLRQIDSRLLVIGESSAPPAFDVHAPLLSLPHLLRVGVVPPPVLGPEEDKVERWRDRLGSHGLKLGIAWQGANIPIDVGRSFAVAQFAPLGRLPTVRLISLQKNAGVEQLAALPDGMAVETLGDDFDNGPDAFADTAAVMKCLDLIITSDTAIAHLAGSLGCPTWIVLRDSPDWRWFRDRSDSPWYPSMRLFRQPCRGDWASVFTHIAAEALALQRPLPDDSLAVVASGERKDARPGPA